jgi:hypothetical protein
VEGAVRVYVEAIEIQAPETGEEPDFVRVDVTGLSEGEVQDVVNVVRELMKGTSYILQLHYCFHDEDPPRPCNIVLLEAT